jgi:hypothetical protein
MKCVFSVRKIYGQARIKKIGTYTIRTSPRIRPSVIKIAPEHPMREDFWMNWDLIKKIWSQESKSKKLKKTRSIRRNDF